MYSDDGDELFEGNSEIVTFVTQKKSPQKMCVLQTKDDFDVKEELDAMCQWAIENDYDEQSFWMEFDERGYVAYDFEDEDRIEWAERNLKDYGLR